jgi:phosphoesterase RecJ-like protein
MKNDELLMQVRQRIADSKKIAVIGHIRPDGDAIGSLLGLGLALQQIGKEVQMVLSDGVLSRFRHLSGSDRVIKQIQPPVDLVIAVDASSFDRLGPALNGSFAEERLEADKPLVDICFDHHATNTGYAEINIVEPQEVAVAAMLTKYMPGLGLQISAPVAEALLTGIITDTIGFRTPAVDANTLRLVVALMEAGASLSELYFKGLVERPCSATLYWGAGLSKLRCEDGIVWSTLTVADRKAAGYPGNDDADLVSELSGVKEADIAVLFVEQEDRSVKISWRASKDRLDVSTIARQFGGGGHRPAAGAKVNGLLGDVVKKVMEATRQYLTEAES